MGTKTSFTGISMTPFSLQMLVYEWDQFGANFNNDVFFTEKKITESENSDKIGQFRIKI